MKRKGASSKAKAASSVAQQEEDVQIELQHNNNNENECAEEGGFFACYPTYIGFTVNPRPWEMVLCIYGFPTNVSALQFEWAWQHPIESLAVRNAAVGFKSLSGVANKIKLAYTMLTLPSWESMDMTVTFFSTKYMKHCAGCPNLPQHMTVEIGSMDELPCYTERIDGLLEKKDDSTDEVEFDDNIASTSRFVPDASDDFITADSPKNPIHRENITEPFGWNKESEVTEPLSHSFTPFGWRTRIDEHGFNNDDSIDRENGYKGKLKKNVNFRGMESGEERSGEKFYEKRKLSTLDSFGRKKRVYAKEGMDESGKSWSGVEISKKKILFKKGEKKVRDETVEEKIVEEKTDDDRTMWDFSKLKKAKSKDKLSNQSLKDKKEIDGIDDSGSNLKKKKKNGEMKAEFSYGKIEEIVSPSSSDMKEPGLDDDAKKLEDRRYKKKKRLIKIDPYDISNKRFDDAIGVDGNKEEKKKDSEKEPEMSLNAQFRAIQPSPSILTFVEKNLLGRRRMIDIKRAGYNIELPSPLDNIPFSKSSERENIEENVFRNRLEFFAAAKVSSSFPPPNLPEIAFAGKSNVGKSSLLNALTRQWGVVRTSDKPGHTQTINFFSLGTKLSLVDLPGYGFAYAKEEVKEAWEDLVKEYVSTRVGLKQVCLLIDTKWGMKPRDHELIELMERSKTKYQIVLTKTDTVFPIDVARRAMQIEESLLPNKSVIQPLMMVSSKSGAGIRSLRTVLANVARFVKI